MMLGMNSNLPTVFLGNAGGVTKIGDVGIGTATPSARLDVKGWLAEDMIIATEESGAALFAVDSAGGISASGSVDIYGDLDFESADSGLLYGSYYGNDIGYSTASAVQNEWYVVVDADIAEGPATNSVLFQNNKELKVEHGGVYLINWSADASSTANNTHIHIGIGVNDAVQNAGQCHMDDTDLGEEAPMSGTAILSISTDQRVSLMIQTPDAGTPDLGIENINLTVVQIGGN